MVNSNQYIERFKDAPWIKQRPAILVAGLGGIGSSTMYCLTKTVPGDYLIIDPDVVEAYNVGCQFFTKADVNKKKAHAVDGFVKNYTEDVSVFPVTKLITDKDYLPITIAAFDNMAARKQLFENWKKQPNRELFLDARLRASLYEVYVVIPGREERYEATLFADSEADDGPCTLKQTAYFAMLVGARLTHMVVNYLTNKAIGEDICNLPFFITEVGEPVFINVNE